MIVLTGRAAEADRVRSFQRGADDHVWKPFLYAELLGRIRAVLRRAEGRRGQGHLAGARADDRPVDTDRALAGRRIELSAKEFALLHALALEPGRVYRKQELLRDVWGYRSLAIRARSTRTPAGCARSSALAPALGAERARRGLQAHGGGV